LEKPFYRVSTEQMTHGASTLWYVFGWVNLQEKKILAVCPTQDLAETLREELIRRRSVTSFARERHAPAPMTPTFPE
jgi:hypothetical protein